jgi:hypothetical protein
MASKAMMTRLARDASLTGIVISFSWISATSALVLVGAG